MDRARTGRAAWHARANAVVVAYLAAAVVALALHGLGAASGWLVLHLFVLGAVTNAIVVWTAHFASTLLRADYRASATVGGRLVVLNAGVLAVLVGVPAQLRWLTVGGAAALTLVVCVHVGMLVRAAWGRGAGRFAASMRFYWAAGAALLAGVAAGTALTFDLPGNWPDRLFAAHVHLNVFGWIALTVLGTEFSFWPMVLRTRMADGVEVAARHALPLCAVGLALATTGFVAGNRPLAAVGLVGYLGGVARSLEPFVRTLRRNVPRAAAAWMLAAATSWLAVALCCDLVAVVRPGSATEVADRVEALVPWLIVGFVVQVLMGALGYLLPVVLGRGPTGGRRLAALLDRGAVPRIALFNAAVAVLALPAPAALDGVAWVVIGAAVAVFAVLAGIIVTRALTLASARSQRAEEGETEASLGDPCQEDHSSA